MSSKRRLKLSAAMFGVLWTAGMLWWNASDGAGAAILTVCGAIAALLWYALMRIWMVRQLRRARAA
jgi:hypothetical protein